MAFLDQLKDMGNKVLFGEEIAKQKATERQEIHYNKEMESLISMAIVDGSLSETEHAVLVKKAQTMGIDLDEFEMVLDYRINKDKSAPKKTVAEIDPNLPCHERLIAMMKIAEDEELGKKGLIGMFNSDPESAKLDVLEKFPIPNKYEDIVDLLAYMIPKGEYQKPGLFQDETPEMHLHNMKAKPWHEKCAQLWNKSKALYTNDPEKLSTIKKMVKVLDLK